MDRYLFRRIASGGKIRKILLERLTEPLHLNIAALPVLLFGGLRARIAFDLVVRQQYAFSILLAADRAKELGKAAITVVEVGVASGAGLMNMCRIAARVTRLTGVEIRVVGFDSGAGLPPPVDYRDYPEAYREGDFPMDFESLRQALPENARLVIGDIADTIPVFLEEDADPEAPIGFVAVDVDYYSSAKAALRILEGPAEAYMPRVVVYLDDIGAEFCSAWTGELLAVNEFNEGSVRKIAPFPMLRSRRIFKNAKWIEQIYLAQIHDHEMRSPRSARPGMRVLENEYLNGRGRRSA